MIHHLGGYCARAVAAFLMSVAAFAPLAAQVDRIPAPADTTTSVRRMLRLMDTGGWIGRLEFGRQLVEEHPDDPVAHALNALAQGEYARASTEAMVQRWPENAWVHLARGSALRYTNTGESQESLARARRLAPDDPNIAYLAADIHLERSRIDEAIALVDTFVVQGRVTPELRTVRAQAMAWKAVKPVEPDSLLLANALAEFAAIRSVSPTSVRNLSAEARVLLGQGRHAEALPLLARAAELSSGDGIVLQQYWRALRAQPGRPLEHRLADVFAAVDRHLEARRHSPAALLVATRFFVRGPNRAARQASEMALLVSLWDRLITEYPETREAATAALERVELIRDSIPRLHGADSIAAVRRYRAALDAIVGMPGATRGESPVIPWPSVDLATEARIALFRDLRGDPLATGEALWSLYERMRFEPTSEQHLRFSHLEVPGALAERGVRLAEAESLVRGALDALEDRLEARRDELTVEQYAQRLSAIEAHVHNEVGWVLFHAGKLAEARRALEKAHELAPRDAGITLRLGRVVEAEDDIETAEAWYALGHGMEPEDGANSQALAGLHATRRPADEGLDAYVAAIFVREQARRRQAIAEEWIAGGQPLVAFELEWMDGGRFKSAALEGKIVILNFWGVWCDPCRREAPDIQKLADELRDDPEVVLLTIANDKDPETTREWMRRQGYTFPVLLEADSRLGERIGLRGYPTTLFVGRDGRVAFRAGESPRLVEEYGWRLEMLREGASR